MSNELDAALRSFLRKKGIDPDDASTFPDAPVMTEEQRQVDEEETEQVKWDYRLYRCNVPKRYAMVPRSMDLPDGLADWQGSPWAVTLMGNAGCGKSFMAIHLLGKISRADGPRSYFYDATVVWQEIKDEFGTDRSGTTMDRMRNADVLLLDDVGADRVTDFQAEQLSIVLTDRYNNVRPTILTTNAPNLGAFLSPRLVSRLSDGIVIRLSGNDRRGRK